MYPAVRERGDSEGVVPSRQNVGAVAGKGGRGMIGRQPTYVYYINIIIIVIKAKLEAVQV